MPEIRHYALGTQLVVNYPWGIFCGGRALCPDGKVRALKRIAQTADTFFSVPASVEVVKEWAASSRYQDYSYVHDADLENL